MTSDLLRRIDEAVFAQVMYQSYGAVRQRLYVEGYKPVRPKLLVKMRELGAPKGYLSGS